MATNEAGRDEALAQLLLQRHAQRLGDRKGQAQAAARARWPCSRKRIRQPLQRQQRAVPRAPLTLELPFHDVSAPGAHQLPV